MKLQVIKSHVAIFSVTWHTYSFVLYADDTNAFFSNSCLKTLSSTVQNEMNKVVKWLNANKLSINASKTKFVIFRSKNKSLSNTAITIKINHDLVEQAFRCYN